jgi:hypothetical protein
VNQHIIERAKELDAEYDKDMATRQSPARRTREQLAAAYQFGIDTDQPCATCWHRREHTCLRLDIDISDPERSTCPAWRERPAGNQTDYAEQRIGIVMDMLLLALSPETLRAMYVDVCRTRDAGPWYGGGIGIQQEWREAWTPIITHLGEIIGKKEQEQEEQEQ